MEKYDIIIIGYAINQRSGGYGGKSYTFLDTVDAKYLYNNCFLDTYCAEPMAFMQIAAHIEKSGLTVKVIDGLILGYDLKSLMNEIEKLEASVFAFSIYESTKEDIYSLARWVKNMKKDCKVVVGGPYATIDAEEILNESLDIDFIVVGDGDEAMPELVSCIKNNHDIEKVSNLFYRKGNSICKTPAKCVDLNKTFFPKRLYSDIIIQRGYSFCISSSRGCGYANCAFCYLKKYQEVGGQPKYRYKNADMVFNEIKQLIDDFGIKKLSFCDEDFFGNDDGLLRAERLFNMIVENNIKISMHVNARVNTVIKLSKKGLLPLCANAGVKFMYVGLESYNDEALKRYDKAITTKDIDYVVSQLDKYNIRINPGLITFDPLLTIDEVKRNVDLYRRIHYYDAFIFTRRLVIYPNAPHKIQELDFGDKYFKYSKTQDLYEAMEKFRDAVFPIFMSLNREIASNSMVDSIINEHYHCFYETYEAIRNDQPDKIESYHNQHIVSIMKIIKLATSR